MCKEKSRQQAAIDLHSDWRSRPRREPQWRRGLPLPRALQSRELRLQPLSLSPQAPVWPSPDRHHMQLISSQRRRPYKSNFSSFLSPFQIGVKSLGHSFTRQGYKHFWENVTSFSHVRNNAAERIAAVAEMKTVIQARILPDRFVSVSSSRYAG